MMTSIAGTDLESGPTGTRHAGCAKGLSSKAGASKTEQAQIEVQVEWSVLVRLI